MRVREGRKKGWGQSPKPYIENVPQRSYITNGQPSLNVGTRAGDVQSICELTSCPVISEG